MKPAPELMSGRTVKPGQSARRESTLHYLLKKLYQIFGWNFWRRLDLGSILEKFRRDPRHQETALACFAIADGVINRLSAAPQGALPQ